VKIQRPNNVFSSQCQLMFYMSRPSQSTLLITKSSDSNASTYLNSALSLFQSKLTYTANCDHCSST